MACPCGRDTGVTPGGTIGETRDRATLPLGLQATNASSAAEWTTIVRRAEELGYSAVHLADHYLGPGAAHAAQGLAAIPAMAAAAAVTETIRVGCRVFCIDFHVPAVLAKEVATIELLSDGRLELGLGAGWVGDEYAAMGLEFDRAGVRIDRLVVALMKAYFAGEDLEIDGSTSTSMGTAERRSTAATAPSDHDRRWCQTDLDVCRPRSGHRQPELQQPCRGRRSRRCAELDGRTDGRTDRLGARGCW